MTSKIENISPGEILLEEFLKPMNISQYRLAKEIGVSQTRIYEIVHSKRSITPNTALKLSKFFGNSPEFWMGIQADYDLEKSRDEISGELKNIKQYSKSMD